MADILGLGNDSVFYRLEGQIIDGSTGLGIDAVFIDLWDAENIGKDLVAHAKTNALGQFSVSIDAAYYRALFLDRQPVLSFRLYKDGQLPSPAVTWKPSATTTHLRIPLSDLSRRPQDAPAAMVVRGRVTQPNGTPLAGHVVTGFDQTLRVDSVTQVIGIKEVSLGSATTDAQGQYRISYTTSQLVRAGSLHADLVIRVRPAGNSNTTIIIAESPQLCHAPTTATIDLVAGNVALRGLSEYERVYAAVIAEIGTTAISTVIDAQIPYLACTVEQPENLVRTLIQAHRLAAQIPLDVIPLYGILRQGFPAVKRDLLTLRPTPLRAALDRSIAANIIPPMATTPLNTFYNALIERMVDLALATRANDGSALGEILPIALSDANDRREFAKTLITHEDDATFWTTISGKSQFSSTEVTTLQRIIQWGVFSRYHIPLVLKLEQLFAANTLQSVRDLANYDENDWYALLTNTTSTTIIGAPADIPGATAQDKYRNYAKVLERTVESAFPTAVIAKRFQRDSTPATAGLVQFFTSNANFDFKTNRVAAYLATNPTAMASVTDVPNTTARLQGLERVFRLTPRYVEIKPLLDAGLDSAQSIHRMSRARFVSRMRNTTMGAARAEQVYGRACWVAGAATALFGKYSAQLNNVPVYALPDLATPAGNPSPKAADWSKLFGSPDACACEYCRSVYSPAAYLVDLLEFLDRHDTTLPTGDPTPGNPHRFSLRDLLIGDLHNRPNPIVPCRPDIGRIQLSCKNTNATVPYIDLVNEILEMVVANIADNPDHSWPAAITSVNEVEDLLAEPEIIHPAAHNSAYVELSKAVHPFDLPWDFWASETRTYLGHLGVPRHELLETFIGTVEPQPTNVADKIARERLHVSKLGWQIITNTASPAASTQAYWGLSGNANWQTDLSKVPIFLQKSGLPWEELRELLESDYLPGSITLTPIEGCDIDAKVLNGFTTTNLEPLHRFLRLRLHAGLTISEMDRVTTTFGKADIDEPLFRHIADIVALKEELGLSVSSLLACWGDMGTKTNEWSKSIYEQVFLTKAVLAYSNVFANLANVGAETLLTQSLAIRAALGINLAEFELLTSNSVCQALIGLPCVVGTNVDLTLSNLSRLYRVVTLSQALGLSIAEFVILRALSGLNVVKGDDATDAIPATTRKFIALVRQIKASALNAGDLQYLARHVVAPGVTVGLSEPEIAALRNELQELVMAINADEAAAVAGGNDPSSPAALQAQYAAAIYERLANEWNIEADVIEHLMAYVLHEPPALTNAAIVPFYAVPNASTEVARNEILRRLEKVALLSRRLQFGAIEWSLIYPTNGQTDWTSLDDVPIGLPIGVPVEAAGGSGYISQFQRLVRFIDVAALRDVMPNKAETLRSIGETITALQNNTISETTFFDTIANLTGWLRADVEFLMLNGFGYPGLPPNLCQCLEERAYLCLSRAIDMLKKLRSTAAQASLWANIDAVDPKPAALDVKRVTRTHYDVSSWPEAARKIRESLRERQRDALVHYLVSKQNLEGSNDLFDKHLIDVEMSDCQLTSRIKMAIGSVQTFVQRVLLGLMSSVATLDEDAAQEWSWMKNYRVWEANRKIFLYPENWIEPELRDDKTPFFRTLESRLLQGEINAEAVEGAYSEYLESLHEAARLEVAALCHEVDESNPNDRVDIVHVIARTASAPHRYYYRKRMDSAYWTPWEKVDIDIQGDHLLATTWNRRLYLFWPVFGSATVGTGNETKKRQRIDLAWTSYVDGRFVKVNVTKESPIRITDDIDSRWVSLLEEHGTNSLTIQPLISLFGADRKDGTNSAAYTVVGSFVISPCGGKAEIRELNESRIGWAPFTAAPEYAGFAEFSNEEKNSPITNVPGRDDLSFPVAVIPGPNKPPVFTMILGKTPLNSTAADMRYSVVVERNPENVMDPFAIRRHFAYADPRRAYFAKLVKSRAKIYHKAWLDPVKVVPVEPIPLTPELELGFDAQVVEWIYVPSMPWQATAIKEGAYQFQTFYHPYVCDFTKALARDGIDGLLRWSSQSGNPLQLQKVDNFATTYEPNVNNVAKPYPLENVDFSFGGAYSQYNWELFFHAPFLIATRLTQNSRYEDADKWYRYIFDPTGGAPGIGVERFWYVKPFRENLDLASIQAQLEQLAQESAEAKQIKDVLEASFDSEITQDFVTQIVVWRENPFQPHVIARMRPLAYQKNVVMKYIDNLLKWGDSLFRRETIEAINEATQLYILAQRILGKRPRIVKIEDVDPKTYIELEPTIDAFSNALVQVESLVPPPPNPSTTCPRREPPPVMRLYFCVPPNENMLRLWDTVEDRLFKIRHCQDIDGNVRQLPLFEPPIDPALLVRATAMGLDITAILLDQFAPLPLYRYAVLHPKAMEFASSVISLGNTLLSVLEKRDGETLARMRATQEINLLTSIRATRQRQIDEATETLEGLRRSRAVIEERRNHYASLEFMNTWEGVQNILTGQSLIATLGSGLANAAAGVLKVFPQIAVGTTVYSEFGGEQLAGVLEIAAQSAGTLASMFGTSAGMAGTQAGYQRRAEDWSLQVRLADRELAQIDKQILAAEIRLDIATKELANHELSLQNASEVEEHLRTKFTNEELFVWLIERAKEIYYQGYKLAYDMAKRAERAFNFELGLLETPASHIQANHWDSAKQGLMAGEHLQLDLRRMDAAYVEQNKREYEITKHVSLAEIAPIELMKIRGGKTGLLDLQEKHLDQDWPGHYLRRIKSTSLTVPVTNAPYGSVNCKLALTFNDIRVDERGAAAPQFKTDYARAESIVTSMAQNDGGLFELVFRDDRYLPFEGAGAISKWEITLAKEGNRFDPSTIHDVVMHLRYTARHKGSSATTTATLDGYRLFSAKTDFPDAWSLFVEGSGAPLVHKLELRLALRHFVRLLSNAPSKITAIQLFALRNDGTTNQVTIVVNEPDGAIIPTSPLDPEISTFGEIIRTNLTTISGAGVDIRSETANNFEPWTLTMTSDFDKLDDIWIVCTYK